MQIRQKMEINMKYRIKETIDGHDHSTFMIQYKVLWLWENLTQHYSKEGAEKWIKTLKTKQVKYHTVEQ